MQTIAMLLVVWTCSARSGLAHLYTASAPTKEDAKAAVLAACHAHHPVCVVTKCKSN